MRKIAIGIDPGKSGGVAIIDKNKILLTVRHTPVIGKDYDARAMADILRGYEGSGIFVTLEKTQSMPKQGVVSMHSFGRGGGIWEGILAALDIKHQIIHPSVWSKVMLLGAPGEGKERGIYVAKRLYPEWKPKLKKDLLLADAILLAEYSLRQM